MKYLKNLLFLYFITCFQSSIYSQNIGFEVDNNKGTIENIFIKNNKIIFEISSTKRDIKNIYVFSNQSKADRFLSNTICDCNPRKKMELHKGVNLYIDAYKNVDYAKNYSDNSRAEIVGSIIKIDDIKIEYFKRVGQNSTIGIVGKLKSVNGIPISYHLNYSENQRAGYTGKIEKIGNISFKSFSVWDTFFPSVKPHL